MVLKNSLAIFLTFSLCEARKASVPHRESVASRMDVASSRERVLNDVEIVAFWRASYAGGRPFGLLGQLLLLTGARGDEIGAMTWFEVDLGQAE